MTEQPMGSTREPPRPPLLGPAVPHRTARHLPAEGPGGALPPFVPRRATPAARATTPAAAAPWTPEPEPVHLPDPVTPAEPEAPAPAAPAAPTPAADPLSGGLPQSETLQAARVPEQPAMSQEVGRPVEGDAYAAVADRLESIAQALRAGEPASLLASGDPLTSLILGFAMGRAESSRPGR